MINNETKAILERASMVYPHPIAVACSRVLSARSLPEQLDAILRAGEAVTRYTAALSLASFSARTDREYAAPAGLENFDGPLSWGHFLTVIQLVASVPNTIHPLGLYIAAGFQAKKGEKGKADVALTLLLTIRNKYGHDLQTISQAKAEVIFSTQKPEQSLVNALNSLQGLVGLPLFLIEDQQLTRGRVIARQLLLMGESDNPRPNEIEFSGGLDETKVLYMGTNSGALKLWPWLTWDLAERRVTYAVFIIHAIGKVIKYKSMFGDDLERNSDLLETVIKYRTGTEVTIEDVKLADGRSFAYEWSIEKRSREESLSRKEGSIPWSQLDSQTVTWYAQRLAGFTPDTDPRRIIQNELLDGRDSLQPDEITQLTILFGSEKTIRPLVKRDLLDCRAKKSDDVRWNERILIRQNVVESLRVAVDFFSRHVGLTGATLDGLEATSGSADYIAMREALVNLFIHQDYMDARTVAQVEITPERALFFNAGASLVSIEGLVDGGKSQSRNPLIARGLRLLGFAELAGSGLRALQAEWRQAGRRPPQFENNTNANTFSLTLDWRLLPIPVDSLWKERLGVKVSPQQAQILALLAEPSGFTELEIASGTGLLFEDVKRDLNYLKIQNLIQNKDAHFSLRDGLQAIFSPPE